MPEGNVAPLSLKCNICGGELKNDYLTGSCVCDHCGNKWDLKEMCPEVSSYSRTIEHIKRGKELLNTRSDVATLTQANLLFKSAAMECTGRTDPIAADLLRVANECQEESEKIKHYSLGTMHFEKKNYRKALSEFKKIPGFKDVDEKMKEAEAGAIIERRKHIPIAIIVGMIIPAVLSILLKEKAGLPLAAVIPIFVVLTCAVSYAVYLEGTLATVIIVLSVLAAVPLILFMILAYGMHMDTGTAAIISIGAPIVLVAVVALKPDLKQN